MTTFLFKTEPGVYAYADLVRESRTTWNGVTNPAACLHLRTAKPGDEALIYHTGDERAIAGLARITSVAYPDPKRPGTTAAGATKFPVVDLEPLRAAPTPVTLATIKSDPRFEGFDLIRLPRLSVMPVPPAMARTLRKMAGL